MNVSFIITIDSEAVDALGLNALADELRTSLDEANFDVVDVKPNVLGVAARQQQPTQQPNA